MNIEILFNRAKEALVNSYAPYSNFNVSAALLCSDGTIYTGCNIENASFSATVCAERVALFSAIANGKRQFEAILILGGRDSILNSPTFPCGVCRQALSEFCDSNFKIYIGSNKENIECYSLGELLPHSFDKF